MPRASKREIAGLADRVAALRAAASELEAAARRAEARSREEEAAWWAKRRETEDFDRSVPYGVKSGDDKRSATVLSREDISREAELQRERERHARAMAAINAQHDYEERMAAFRRELDALPHALADESRELERRSVAALVECGEAERALKRVR